VTLKRVLIVDADHEQRQTLADVLGSRGYLPLIASTGQAAVALAQNELPSVILIDLELVDMPGLEVMKEIRRCCHGAECIVLSGCASRALALEAIKAGAYGYVHKPCDVEQLLITVQRAVEKSETDELLRQSEHRYRQLADGLLLGISVFQDGKLVFANETIAEMLGYPVQELLLLPPEEVRRLIHPEDRALVLGRIADRLAGRPVPTHYDFRLLRRGGGVRWVEVASDVIEYRGLPAVQTSAVDITERKLAEESLRRERDRAQKYLDVAGVIMVALGPTGEITLMNRQGYQILGYEEDSLIGCNWFETCLPQWDRDRTRLVFEQLMVGDAELVEYHENSVLTRSGEERVIAWHNVVLMDEKGTRLGTLSSGQDITERVQVEAAIQHRNRELALLNRVIAASSAGQSIERILEVVCRELALAFGVPQSAAALFNEEKTEAVVVAEYLAEGRPPSVGEIIPAVGNPSSQYLLSHKKPLVVDNAQLDPRLAPIHDLMRRRGTVSLLLLPLLVEGEVLGTLGLDAIEIRPFSAEEVDLAWRVAEQVSGYLARARLEETQRRLSTAVEQSAEAVLITDVAGTILYVNPAFERISGYSRAEAIGQNPRMLKSGKHGDTFYRHLWQSIRTGNVWQGRFINKSKDGSLYIEEATITPLRDPAGQIVNYVAVQHNVTREVELEEQFRQAQKMEALGRLAGGVAHDFNNLLTVIHLSTRLLERQVHPGDPLWEHVQRIQDAGQRATKLTKQLLSFSRRDVVELLELNLNDVVRDVTRMLQRIIGEDIELLMKLGKDLWLVHADLSQIDQVIMNLVVNARDAMPDGGLLTIETANVLLDSAYAARHVDAQPGDHVMLAISDTGIGMDAEVKTRIFEPFFTTKEQGKGTGLGLATVYGIVKQAGGHIRFYSEKGHGTTFKVYLPRAEGTGTLRRFASVVGRASLDRGSETVLVVEDDESVRDLTVAILKNQGYRVLIARNGEEALRISQEHVGPIRLLLTDVVMPQMSGRDLAERLRALRPELRVLFMSGYTDETIARHGLLDAGVAFLSKPLTLDALVRKVRDVLEASS
jgi:PAS domain S-box-containing protein